MDQEAKNKFSEKSTTIAVLYALSCLFFNVTEKVNLLFWFLTIKGCSLLKGKREKKVIKVKKKEVRIQILHSLKKNSLDLCGRLRKLHNYQLSS